MFQLRPRPSNPALRRLFGAALSLALILIAAAGSPALARTGGWVRTEELSARLISAASAAGSGSMLSLGLEIALKPGWKTYWRDPGSAGLPVTLDLSASENVADHQMLWPAPHRFTFQGLETFGYSDTVIFPLQVTPAAAGQPMRLRGKLNLLVCDDRICVPRKLTLILFLPAGEARLTDQAERIERFRAQVPLPFEAHGLRIDGPRLEQISDGAPRISLDLLSAQPLAGDSAGFDAILTSDPYLTLPRPEITRSEDQRSLSLRFPVQPKQAEDAASLIGRPMTLTLLTAPVLAEGSVTLQQGGAGASEGGAAASEGGPARLALMLAMALLGGLILNVMPCVLPVLSLKLLGALKYGGAEPRVIRRGFLASAAGILTSFLVLALGAISLRAMGAAVGWGMTFQQPSFVVLLLLVSGLFAMNLLGLFEITLPMLVGRRLAAAGGRPGHDVGLLGHFATGALASLMATPCTAPFMGTALAYALSRGPAEILAIFLAMGAGLALPYLLLAAFPRLARAMPRPGRWMLWVRTAMGFALVGTALWLTWILASLLGNSLAAALVLLAVIGAGLLTGSAARRRSPSPPLLAGVATTVILAFAIPAWAPARAAPREMEAAAGDFAWTAYDPAALQGARDQGRLIFVDVTADWCITCQVNKRLVLGSATIRARLEQPDWLRIKADWTRPDERINRLLAEHGRFGIPFNLVYGPGAPQGLVLPELLTESAVLQALEQAAGPLTSPIATP